MSKAHSRGAAGLTRKGAKVKYTTYTKRICVALPGVISIALGAQPTQTQRFNHPRAHAESISPAALLALLDIDSHRRLFVDVRSEFPSIQARNLIHNFANVRYRNGSGGQLNTSFALEVGQALAAKGLSVGATIVLICGDGVSSSEAAQWLVWVGHTQAVFVQGGISEWVLTQKNDSSLMIRPTPFL